MTMKRKTEKKPIPPEVRDAGKYVFSDEESLRTWLATPARWAEGKTPWQLIEEGKSGDVVDALTALAHGHFI